MLAAMLENATLAHPREEADVRLAEELRADWLARLGALRVSATCDCGLCPSIELTLGDEQVNAADEDRLVLAASTEQSLVLAVVARDVPVYLEVAPLRDGSVPLPEPEALRF